MYMYLHLDMLPLNFIEIPPFRPNFFTPLLCLLFMAPPVVHTSAKDVQNAFLTGSPLFKPLISPQFKLYPSLNSAISQHFLTKGMVFENEMVCRAWSSYLSGASRSHPAEIAPCLYCYVLYSGVALPHGQGPVLEEEQDGT